MDNKLIIKLGHYVTFPLESKSSTNPQNSIKFAFVRYDGMPKSDVFVLEVGRLDSKETNQTANPIYIPTDIAEFSYRVDNYGRVVQFEILKVSPLEVIVNNKTPLPSAAHD